MNNRLFAVFVVFITSLGVVIGYRLSTMPQFQSYKLLNIVGLIYDFLGVVVLSEILAPNPRWKKLSVDVVARLVLWLHTILPLGALLGGLLAGLLKSSSSWVIVSKFAFSFWSYSLIPLSILDATVTFPFLPSLKGLESRWRWFGLYLLVVGIGLQLIAALLGLGK